MIQRSCLVGALCFLTCLSLFGCNGSSGENGPDPFNPDPAPAPEPQIELIVTLLDAQCDEPVTRIMLGDTACISATLTQDSEPLDDQIINLTTTLGALEVSSRLTNNQGIAQIELRSSDATLGAGQIEASYNDAEQATTSATVNFEFLARQGSPVDRPELTMTLTDASGNATNRVSQSESLSVSVGLISGSGTPIDNTIVSFQSIIGTMQPETALTNAQGIASSLFMPGDVLGAGTVSATVETADTELAVNRNVEIVADDAPIEDVIRLGTIEQGQFVENIIGVDGVANDQAIITSAGGTIGFVVALVDGQEQPVLQNIPITFTSTCVETGQATIDQSVVAINGFARATFEDTSCAGANGNSDIVTASVTVNGQQTLASRAISLLPETIGSLIFIDAQPSSIVLAGSGGQEAQTVSTLTFQVNGELGNPLPQQPVNFSLNTQIGGLNLSPVQALTNSEGQVSTRVTAGTVPTSVRVTATVDVDDQTQLQTQSELLTVNTGLPDQNSINLSASDLNPEAFNIAGQTVTLTARLADSFNNPVPNGTAVSFIAEGGSIEPSCTTISGVCSVEWTSGQPRADDHRLTILATAIGHETLADSNGDNQYSVEDGPASNSNDGSGFGATIPTTTGFMDLPEAWLDTNENRVLDGAETFLDFNNSGTYDVANGLFDGPQCQSGCGATSLHVRRALALVTSSSAALLSVASEGLELANNSDSPSNDPVASIARGESITLVLTYTDTAGQPVASGSTIDLDNSAGLLSGNTNDVMPITNNPNPRTQVVTLVNNLLPEETAINSTVTATVTSPSGVVSTLSFVIELQ